MAAGAVGVGIATALAAPGVAYADNAAGTSASGNEPSTSASATGPDRDTTRRDSNTGAARDSSDDVDRDVTDGATDDADDDATDDADDVADIDVDSDDADGEDDADPTEAPGATASESRSRTDRSAARAVQLEEAADTRPDVIVEDEVNVVADNAVATSDAEQMVVVPAARPDAGDAVVEGSAAPPSPVAGGDAKTTAAEEDFVIFQQTGMSAGELPEVPAAPRTLAQLLTAMFVRMQTMYFNRTPIAKPVQYPGQSSQGVVTGTVGASDPDGDPLVVELTAGPTRGAVHISADGSYVYTAAADLAAAGGTDTFTVVVRETNADSHIHGFKGLWSRLLRTLTGRSAATDDGSTVTRTVTVTIAAVSGAEDSAEPPLADSPAQAVSPDVTPVYSKHDAGLSDPFVMPAAPTGKTLNVRNYGATSNRSWDNDATAIQKAINAAVAGDVVYIPDGTYHIKSTINLKSGVSLVGQSRTNTVLAGAYWSSPHAMIYAAPGTTNLTVSTFRITQASGRTYKAAIRLGTESGGVVSRIAVKDLSIEKFQRFGVQLQNAQHVLVDGNIIKNATALDGGGSGYGILIDQSLSNNNWVRNNQIGPVIRHAILIQESAHHNLIELNTITGTVSGAIDLHGEDEYANEIRYNTITNGVRNGTTVSPNGAGIEVGEFSGVIGTTVMHDNSGPGNWIHHNTVYNYSMGLRITNNSNHTFIEDNVFYGNLGAGIQADLAPLNNLYLAGNEIYDNGSGVILYDVTQAVVQDNTIRDNTNYGIWTNSGTTGYVITGNIVTGNGVDVTLGSRDGVYLVPVSV